MTERLDVLFGGPGREAAVSRKSGASIVAAAVAAGFDVQGIAIADRLDPASLRSDSVIFNIVHGTYGEDGRLQAELDALGRCYIGGDAANSRLCMDKEACKQAMAKAGVPVAWGCCIDDQLPSTLPAGTGFVLKPRADGSSVGVEMIDGLDDLAAAVARVREELGPVPLLLEQRLRGDEFTVGLIDDGNGDWSALPPIRIAAAESFYDYQAKYERNDTRYDFAIDAGLAERLTGHALAAVRACGCRDLARVDLMADGDDLFVLEINTLPGFTDHSLVPKAAARSGLAMPDLIRRLVACAQRRAGRCLR